jgi:hypothetical protein
MEIPKSDADRASVAAWLRSEVTATLPGWAFAAGGFVLVVLLLVALD